MALLGQTFKRDDLPVGENNFLPLPAGWYTASIVESDVKPTRDGTGQYIKNRFSILGPTGQGRVVFGNLNIRNKSLDAERIALEQLRDLLDAVNIKELKNTDQLVGGTCQIKLSVKTAQNGYEAGNDIKSYKAVEGSGMPIGETIQPGVPEGGEEGPFPWQ